MHVCMYECMYPFDCFVSSLSPQFNQGMVVDRSMIMRHLNSSPTDPFNRVPLKVEELVTTSLSVSLVRSLSRHICRSNKERCERKSRRGYKCPKVWAEKAKKQRHKVTKIHKRETKIAEIYRICQWLDQIALVKIA